MLTIKQFAEYLRVTGYPDGSDWWVLTEAKSQIDYGAAGPEHFWYGEHGGRLHILHAPTRQRAATVQLEGIQRSRTFPLPVAVSRDERRLFVLEWSSHVKPLEARLHVVDVVSGAAVTVHDGLPPLRPIRPRERPDGRLVLPTDRQTLVLLDPATGDWEESGTPGDPRGVHFGSGSPDGRYWIRVDLASLPVHDDTPGLLDRLLGEKKQPERRYGVTMQLWEAFPLRFVRRVVVAWLTVEELPDETNLAHSDPRARPTGLRSRRAMWDAIATAMATTDASPLSAPPPRSAFPPAVAADDAAWAIVDKNVKALAHSPWGYVSVVGWQPDGDAFWVSSNKFVSCVGVDGTVSPRLYTERLGLQGGTVRRSAASWRELVPLPGRKARAVYEKGEAIFDGAPGDARHAALSIPAGRDGWSTTAQDAAERDRKAAFRRLAALQEERRRLVVPFAGWTEAGCVAAIDALTAEVDENFRKRAVGDDIHVVFTLGDEEIGEERFFTEAGARFPGVAPAIRRLIDRYCDVAKRNDHLFSRGEEAIGIFAWAVKALGVLDHSALPTLRRYGVTVDPEHEHYFAGTTVPAVIQAHGWTDDVVDFVFWVLAWDYYNTLQDYAEIWRDWGLRDAIVHREPRAFARHVAADLAETARMNDDAERYGIAGLDKLAKQIPQPHEPWVVAFLDELERGFADLADAAG